MDNSLLECWRESFKKIAPPQLHPLADRFTFTHILLIYASILTGAFIILHLFFYFRS